MVNNDIINMMDIRNLSVYAGERRILESINISVKRGEVVGIMGPNGSGKSTLVNAIMGNPVYGIEGEILFEGENITQLPAHIRARKGIFLSFQAPVSVDGLTLLNFLRTAYRNIYGSGMKLKEFRTMVLENARSIGFDEEFLGRGLNEGLSGGERKKSEILQMLALKPKLIMLDEIDSGLDVDSIKDVVESINKMRDGRSFIIVSHYARIFNLIKPDSVYVLIDGVIKKKGGSEVADQIEKYGYEALGG